MLEKAIVVGAGPAGLACAAMLRQRSIEPLILEKSKNVGAAWRRHYDRLHLHTDKSHSHLPGLRMPRGYPRYPTRDQVIEYLETYSAHRDLNVLFDCEVRKVARPDQWEVQTSKGTYRAASVVLATGMATYPRRPKWPGQATFAGEILHSSEYANPRPFKERRVLVVGLGNSSGEIALDLSENGVGVALSVRGPVNIIPKEVLGIPILSLAIAQTHLPTWLADGFNRVVQYLHFGHLRKLGLQKPVYGPLGQVRSGGQVPLIDIGTVAAIRKGKIDVRPAIKQFEQSQVEFVDGSKETFDAVILGTGFQPDLSRLIPDLTDLLTQEGAPRASGALSGRDGLFFCSYIASPTGQLREIGIEARGIAAAVARMD